MKMQPTPELFRPDCRFCTGPESERIVLETDHFYVLLTLGPIVEGYTLIVSQQHIECCAAIPEEHRAEFEFLLETVTEAQERLYGKSIYYEHGRTGGCSSDAEGEPHCHHAHLHCVPIAADLSEIIGRDFEEKSVSSWEEVHKRYYEYPSPYLIFSNGGNLSYFDAVRGARRQYLRRLVAASVGSPELADWAAFQGWEQIRAAASTLGPLIRDLYKKFKIN